jgi:dihydroorotate dehydrogenase
MGFAHVELGTVTPRPQPGNPRPRMFRIADRRALINRMGFNNKGVDHLVARISRSRYQGVRGISIGKNFDTPLENAHDDYLTCMRKIYVYAEYVSVYVSSPNTTRWRTAGARRPAKNPRRAAGRCAVLQRYARVPLLVKIAPI